MEAVLLRMPRGAISRVRLRIYRSLGMRQGNFNRMEGGVRVRCCNQISIGDYNAFTQGCWLWPLELNFVGIRIRIGNRNYFNRNVMIDACNMIEIGNNNMFGPDVYVTDSDHCFEPGRSPKDLPMRLGTVRICDNCWIGAKAIILKNVVLGDGCVVAAGAVVNWSVAPGQVVAGVPAMPITYRDSPT